MAVPSHCSKEGYTTVDTNWASDPLAGPTSAAPSAVLAEPTTSVLIVKLGWTETLTPDPGTTCSLGDVLRTTPVLHLFRDSRVTWLTDARAAALLPGKPYIDELLTYGPDTYAQLAGREFGRVVNFECDARLTDLLESFDLKTGPVFQSGRPRSWAARRRRPTTARDCSRGREGKTWSQIIFEMVGAVYADEPMILGHVRRSTITHDIGLNYTVGPKWPTKAWPEERCARTGRWLGGKVHPGLSAASERSRGLHQLGELLPASRHERQPGDAHCPSPGQKGRRDLWPHQFRDHPADAGDDLPARRTAAGLPALLPVAMRAGLWPV